MKIKKISIKSITQKQMIYYLSVLMLLVVLIPLFIMAHYAHMCADDYSYVGPVIASWNRNHSILQLLKSQFIYAYDYYFSWQGTFSMEWLGSTLMVMIAEKHYYLTTYITLGGMVVSELILFMLIGVKALGADKYDTGIVSCWLIALQVLMTPVPVEAFYWLCGGMLYTVGFSTNVLLYVLMFIYIRRSVGGRDKTIKIEARYVLLQIAVIFLIFIVSFGNFVSSIFGFASFLCLVFAVWVRKIPRRFVITLDALVYTSFFVLSAIAPGNRKRMAVAGSEGLGVIEAVIKSLLAAAEYLIVNLYPTVIIILIMMIPFVIGVVKRKAFEGNKTFRFPLFFTAISFGLFASQFVPTMYSLGIIGPGRIINLYRYTMYIWLFSNLIYWIGWILRRLHEEHPDLTLDIFESRKNYLIPVMAAEFIILCYAAYFYGGKTITTVSAINSLRTGQARIYREEHLNRLAVLEDDSASDVCLDSFSNPPYLIHLDDIKDDPDHWLNRDLAAYYGKDSVILNE